MHQIIIYKTDKGILIANKQNQLICASKNISFSNSSDNQIYQKKGNSLYQITGLIFNELQLGEFSYMIKEVGTLEIDFDFPIFDFSDSYLERLSEVSQKHPSLDNPVLVISDIHGNLPALEKILDFVQPYKIYVLGDIIDRYPFPEECINLLKSYNSYFVKGNHEFYFFNPLDLSYEKRFGFTKHLLSEQAINFIKSLPFRFSLDDILLFHSSLVDDYGNFSESEVAVIKEYIDLHNYFLNLFVLKDMNKKIGFFGHTHKPICYFLDDNIYEDLIRFTYSKKSISPVLINPGSVGQNRYSDINMAQFLLFYETDHSYIFDFYEIKYDLDPLIEGIEKRIIPIDKEIGEYTLKQLKQK